MATLLFVDGDQGLHGMVCEYLAAHGHEAVGLALLASTLEVLAHLAGRSIGLPTLRPVRARSACAGHQRRTAAG